MNGGYKNMFGKIWDTSLSANDSTAKVQPGSVRLDYDSTYGVWRKYKYVLAAADTTVANGTLLGYTDAYGNTVSSDIDDFVETTQCAGVGRGVITASYYGWVQVGGYHPAVKTNGDDDIAAGDWIIYGAADGVCDSVASGATASVSKVFGNAAADDVNADNTVAVILTISPI